MELVIDHETGEIIEDVAFQINREHELFESSMKSSIEHAIRCGELLAEQKAKLKHGEWIPWVEKNCEFTRVHAARYLKIAANVTRVLHFDSGASLRGVLKLLAKNEREENIEQQRQEIEEGIFALPPGTFEVIVIDPPWPYGTEYDPDGRRAANPYPEMSLEEITNIKLPATSDCVLWLWTTHKFMRYSFGILDAWGFRDVAIVTWVKDRMGLGSWLRSQSEFCIMAVKGSPKVFLTNQTTVIHGVMREHSRKPDEFYAMVESLCVGRKLDYYSREARQGWEQYGNELERFTEG
jgi:N6-adenosine-specific RNA methylase IME4